MTLKYLEHRFPFSSLKYPYGLIVREQRRICPDNINVNGDFIRIPSGRGGPVLWMFEFAEDRLAFNNYWRKDFELLKTMEHENG